MNDYPSEAYEHRQTVGWLLVWFGAFGVISGALAQWLLALDLGFLSTIDMALIGCTTTIVGVSLLRVPPHE